MLPHTPFSRRVDRVVDAIGRAISWVWAVLLIVIVTNVILRYAFGEGRIEFEEIQWHLYSIGFLLGLSFAWSSDNHIRVDVLHERFSPRRQAWAPPTARPCRTARALSSCATRCRSCARTAGPIRLPCAARSVQT